MKRIEVIERLKQGDTIIFDSGQRTFGTIFKSDRRSMRYDTVLNLIKEGLVNREYSKTAYAISYITWKQRSFGGEWDTGGEVDKQSTGAHQ